MALLEWMDPQVAGYVEELGPERNPLLLEMEEAGRQREFPIIGPQVGALCRQWALAIHAKRVLELGSGFGYSAAWFAQAVGPEGEVVHTDTSEELSDEARHWMKRLDLEDRVRFEVGDALETAERLGGEWDIIFCDIDKKDYPRAWNWAKDHVAAGGLIITDNTLWQGKVADENEQDEATEAVREYNRLAFDEHGFLTTMAPIRDGVTVSLRVHP